MKKGALRLPGFFSAKELIPSYTFVSSSSSSSSSSNEDTTRSEITVNGYYNSPIGVSAVEEIPIMISSSSNSGSDDVVAEEGAKRVRGGGGGYTTSLSVTQFNAD